MMTTEILITEIITAPQELSMNPSGKRSAFNDCDGFDLGGISTASIIALHALTARKTRDEVAHLYKPLNVPSTKGPWVYLLPSEFVVALADLSHEETEILEDQWLATDELQAEGVTSEFTGGLVGALSVIAGSALRKHCGLFLWQSMYTGA